MGLNQYRKENNIVAVPKITVLMSVFNGEKFIRESIDSILSQTYKDFEFIIINDCSKDKTAKILSSYNDTRIKIIHNNKNIGLTKSLNIGLQLAKGKYIARMDSDDISINNRLEVQYNYLENNPQTGMVSCWVQLIDDQGKNLLIWDKYNYEEEIYYALNFRNCIAHSSVMFRKDIIMKIGGYNENILLAQDYELWYRLSKKTKIYKIQDVFIKWRKTKLGLSSKFQKYQKNSAFALAKEIIEFNIKTELSEEKIQVLQSNTVNCSIDIQSIIYALEIFNENLLLKEDVLIKKMGLNKRKIIKLMKYKINSILSSCFRYSFLKGNIKIFINLCLYLKFDFLKYYFLRLLNKPFKSKS